ncbi:MAG: ComEA family DNA-binding protein [Candidatus Omnitrophica bacterium]|nr:ComEA family DNA-binding protein [Candidatus Omnitrophota bacterium]
MFNLERLEKKLIIFLLAALLVGTGVIIYRRSSPVGNLRIESHQASPVSSGKDISESSKKININKASVEELTGLKGVGPVLAGRIAEYRLKNGLFVSTEDLKKVPGIGDKLFSKIKDDVSLE